MISRAKYLLLNLYHILVDGLFDAIPILLAFMALSFGTGEKEIGVIVSLGTAAATAAGLGTLFFSRHFAFLRATGLVTALYGIGFLAASFAGNIMVAGLCFIVGAAGHNIFHNISFSYLTLNTDKRRLGRIMSDFTAIGDIGRIPLVSLAAFAAAYSYGTFPGWRVICLTYGTLTLGAAVWLLFFTRKEKPQAPAAGTSRSWFPAFTMLKDKDIFLSVLASLLNAFSNDRIFTFLPLLLIAKGIDPKIIGSFALVFTLGSFLGKMACGRFVDAFGPRKVFIVAELALTIFLCILILANSLILIILTALMLGIITKGTVPVIQTIITEPVRDLAAYDDVFSINSFLRGITNMLTPLLFGFVSSVGSMDNIYAIMAAVAALAILPVLLMTKPHSHA